MADSGIEMKAQLRVFVPQDWYFKESITLLAPDGQANVISSSEPLDPDITTDQYASVQGKLLEEEFPEYIEIAFEPSLVFGGLAGWMRRFEWTPPDGGVITQVQIYAVKDSRGFTATATTPITSFDDYEQSIYAILGSLRVDQFANPAAEIISKPDA
jgi:hypothetical protein